MSKGIGLTDYFDDNRYSIIHTAKENKHDGILFSHKGEHLVIPFEPHQIKSAIGNTGEFHPNKTNITESTSNRPFTQDEHGKNIVFDNKATDAEIIKVLKLVSLEKYYQHLEKGLDTELGERGIKMSGGERQRVALARLFFEESSIVILDEATSALDNITEKEVMTNIMTNAKDKTLIIIAHRLETIKSVDKILVLSSGEIKEEGTYQELLNKKNYFYNLVNSKK